MTTAARFIVYIAKYKSCLYTCSSSHAFSEAEMGRAGTEFPFANLPRKFLGENVQIVHRDLTRSVTSLVCGKNEEKATF